MCVTLQSLLPLELLLQRLELGRVERLLDHCRLAHLRYQGLTQTSGRIGRLRSAEQPKVTLFSFCPKPIDVSVECPKCLEGHCEHRWIFHPVEVAHPSHEERNVQRP